ncbi:hypothetical protein HRbin36_01133 [bacterium HR36]|nr:hypothetical protein HRbin36_01133 [bacterium HR36]
MPEEVKVGGSAQFAEQAGSAATHTGVAILQQQSLQACHDFGPAFFGPLAANAPQSTYDVKAHRRRLVAQGLPYLTQHALVRDPFQRPCCRLPHPF